MKATSKIQKGRRLENFIAEQIEYAGLGHARREVGSGSGKRKGDIFANIPFLIEAKHQNKISILNWIDQAKRDSEAGNANPDKWSVVFNDFRKGEFQELYAVIDFNQFLDLLKRESEPKVKEPDREFKWLLTNLKNICNKIIKRL